MKYIIDRFEGSLAVCEDEQGSMISIEKSKIPPTAKEGDVIYITSVGIEIDASETEKRKARIEELSKELWK